MSIMRPVVKSQTIREGSLPILGKRAPILQQKSLITNRYEKYLKVEDGKEKIILKQMINNNKIKLLEYSSVPKNQYKSSVFASTNLISQVKQAQPTYKLQLSQREKTKSIRQRDDRYLSNEKLLKKLKLPKKMNESSNSSDDENLAQSIIKDDEHHLAVPTIFVLKKNAEHNLIDTKPRETLFLSQGEMISSKNSRSMPSIDHLSPSKLAPIYSNYRQEKYIKQKLVGQQAVSKFYNRYKNMDKIKNLQDFRSEFNPITAILTILQSYNIPPKRMELIKVRGHEAILDLHNCALGSSVSLKAVSQIISKVRVFEEIDLSNNNIHGDLCDVIVPNLSRMRKINLADNKIGRRGVQLLSEMISAEQDCELSELFLQSNHISDSAIGNLFTSILKIKNLKILNLSKNWLGTFSAARIKEFLISDVYLMELYLHWCELGTKATKMIFQGISKNKWLKVLDISWNQIGLDSVPAFCSLVKNNHTLIHLDISFCQIDQADTLQISEALKNNQTLYGLHYQGNLGYIDFKGYLHPIKKQNKHTPLSIRAGLIQRINSVSIVKDIHISSSYDSIYCRNICWICEGWQQKYFKLPKNEQDKCCFIHFDFQQYTGVLMNDNGSYFQLLRMCPPRQIIFFHTKVNNQNIFRHAPCSLESGGMNIMPYNDILHDFMIQHKSFSDVFMDNLGVIIQPKYYSEIFNDEYVTHVHSMPRAADLKANSDIFKVKQKELKEPTLLKQIELKQIPQDFQKIFNNKIEQDNSFLKRCVDFDFAHSKIAKLVKNQKDINELKSIFLKHYDTFQKVYNNLSNNNPNANGVYSISEGRFEKFVEEQGYQSGKMTNIKIRLKVISSLFNHQNDMEIQGFYRPQFFQFLLRYAIEKWCQRQKNQFKDNINKKQRTVLSIPQAFSKMLKTLRKYEQKADVARWCSSNLAAYQITILFKSYDPIFTLIYEKYTGLTQKNMSFRIKKKMLLDQCKNIFLNAQFRKSKQTLKDLEIAYRSAKKVEVEDGIADTGLDYIQFLQAFSRFADGIVVPPIGTENRSLWERQLVPVQEIPLFLKIQKLLKIVYLSNYDLRSKKMDFILQHGLFAEQIQVLMNYWKQKYDGDKQPVRKNISKRLIKLNSLQGDGGNNKINLQFLIELLRVKANEIIEENKRKMIEYQMERDAQEIKHKPKPIQNDSQLLPK